MRVWTFALFANRINGADFEGDVHFFHAEKDHTKSSMLGFIVIILIELPIAHLLLTLFISHQVAAVISMLTIFGLLFMVGEYRAIDKRPTSVSSREIIVRYGIFNVYRIPRASISSISLHTGRVPRSPKVKRFNWSGAPNIEIALKDATKVYLGLDKPDEFVRLAI